jgi:pSer/pThr/pTyr-binding forkhead associated (FHA) protein
MDAKLVVVGENAKPSEIKLNLPVIIGRGRRSNLVLPLPTISRRHCEIFAANGYLMVRDLNSMNGTLINNCRIKEAVLAPGALLTVGSITFRAVYEIDREAREMPPSPEPTAQPVALTTSLGAPTDSAARRRTVGVDELESEDADGEEVSTEVSDVDPEELLERLREAQQRSEES